jgi:pimeloyl-ACP methyl ester carboxylesterase
VPVCRLSSGLDLYYVDKGQGEPLLFLNGLSGDHLYWMGQLRTFARRYRCLVPDNRDVGQSSYAAGPYSSRDMAGDFVELLESLQAPPAHVIGLSLGGMVAQELALLAPARVKSLILTSTLARVDEWFRLTLAAFTLIRRGVADTPSFFEAILPWWVSHRYLEHPGRLTWLRGLLQQAPHPQRLDGFLRQLAATQSHDALERLPTLNCPVAVIVGEDDMVCPLRYARQMCDALPQAELVILSGVGHAPPLEDPPAFQTAVQAFLNGRAALASWERQRPEVLPRGTEFIQFDH